MAALKKRSYRLEWETQLRGKFKTKEQMPYRLAERDRLANVMTFAEIQDTSVYDEEIDKRLRIKWKELTHFYHMVCMPEHKHGVIENALWRFGDVTIQQFVMSINYEYKFVNMDAHLKRLYYSLDGGTRGQIDWRDITASLQILIFYRLVRDKSIDLLEIIFDVYAAPVEVTKQMQKTMSFKKISSENYIDEFKGLLRIILLPCRAEHEIKTLSDLFEQATYDHFKHSIFESCPRITRGAFRQMLLTETGTKVVQKWSGLCWALLPVQSRLTVLDETQERAQENADLITAKYRWRNAVDHYDAILIKKVFREWRIASAQGVFVRLHVRKKAMKKRVVFFYFWLHHSQKCRLQRRRKLLAEVMCNYTIKARIFNRIKLYNYTKVLINRSAGKHYKDNKLIFEGYARLRTFRRMYSVRKRFHQWWEQCVRDHNDELATDHRRIKYTWPVLMQWHEWAHRVAHERRMDMVVLENQKHFEDMMKAADEDVAALMEAEKSLRERKEAVVEEAKKIKRAEKFEKAKAFVEEERQKEHKFTVKVQRDRRRRRVRKQMKKMKKDFNKKWNRKTARMVEEARVRVESYLADKESELAIKMKFEKLKREFYAAPTPEWEAREKILTSPKNIVFLYLERKMINDGITLENIVAKFGGVEKGYLTYDEFRTMVTLLRIGLTPYQITACIKAVDADGDGCLEIQELKDSMCDTDKMGVMGSDWKLYVDPAQDVICYHNFSTGEKVLEYKMTDEKLMEIHHANYYGEAQYQALEDAKTQRAEAWDFLIKDTMARRIQGMYRVRRARKKRAAKVWQVLNRQAIELRTKQKLCISFMERTFKGRRTRDRFAKQLQYTYEKVWDLESGRLFWLNHLTKQSVWERPLLLWKYGDVEMPSPWVAIPDQEDSDDGSDVGVVSNDRALALHARPSSTQSSRKKATSYWHVTAKRSIPRKPDGLLLCGRCEVNMATRRCEGCEGLLYCFSCHRDTHGHPLNFCQNTRASDKQMHEPNFLTTLQNHTRHTFNTNVEGIPCDQCKGACGLLAAFRCVSCGDVNQCRQCHRRLHEHRTQQGHEYYII